MSTQVTTIRYMAIKNGAAAAGRAPRDRKSYVVPIVSQFGRSRAISPLYAQTIPAGSCGFSLGATVQAGARFGAIPARESTKWLRAFRARPRQRDVTPALPAAR